MAKYIPQVNAHSFQVTIRLLLSFLITTAICKIDQLSIDRETGNITADIPEMKTNKTWDCLQASLDMRPIQKELNSVYGFGKLLKE